MEFQIYSVGRHSETEALVHGRFCGDEHLPATTLRVKNVVSRVYFLASPGHEEELVVELRAYTSEIVALEKVVRHNIFFRSLDRRLELLQATLRRPVSFAGFESDYCELVQTEFSSPVENLVVSRGLRGACLTRIETSGGWKPGAAIDARSISYAGPGVLSGLRTVALDLESRGGSVVRFSLHDGARTLRGELGGSVSAGDDEDLVGRAAVETRVFKTHGELLRFLNASIAGYDVVVYHNFHDRFRLNLRGKIVCDMFDFASGHLRGRDFSVAELAELYGIPVGGAGDLAVALLEIFVRTGALGLAKELSEISGCPLNRCLGSSRMELIEYMLLHELHARGYLLPPSMQKKAVNYTGGLVLEPQQGLYEDIVLLLDFNSLYPSIIREFDVCFSSVGLAEDSDGPGEYGPQEGKRHRGAGDDTLSFLPGILQGLVEKRAAVKALLRAVGDGEERTALDARQRAIKLMANSIYGCLGSPTSRFCNYRMASYITAKGRELLGAAKAAAEALGLRVIYGDTDSIMIHTRLPGEYSSVPAAMECASRLVGEINARYRHVEIEVEKVFKRLLLVTKKKYAALVLDGPRTYIEVKGLDMTRRDFCRASTDLSGGVLEIMLEDPVCAAAQGQRGKADRVYDLCMACAAGLQSYPVDRFVIRSSLSRDPSLYGGGVPLPHVSLALRLQREKGIVHRQGDVVPFVVGEGRGPVSDRAFHPSERFAVDYDYYVRLQILPPLLRLVALWPQVSRSRIELIFGVSDARRAQAGPHLLTFTTECCQAVQAPAACCVGCGRDIPDLFYVTGVSRMLEEQCASLYGTAAVCPGCGAKYRNHMQQCFRCGKELAFSPPNREFDELLVALEASFRALGVRQVSEMVALYSGLSAYRIVDLSPYFAEEIAAFEQQHA